MRVLVVDGANVVGSRPDGWWRNREGAARRLREQLSAADLSFDEVILVLEGQARRGSPESREGRVRTVHAGGSGDDAILEEVERQVAAEGGREVTVVTADRLLRDRVEAVSATTESPRWLLGQL
jgi:predicted RNA-binding protein with PIN domain